MSSTVLLRFNSTYNADLFVTNPYNQIALQAQNATVSSGYTPAPVPGQFQYGIPPAQTPQTSTWVTIVVSDPSQIPQGYQGQGPNGPVQAIYNNGTQTWTYSSPQIDTSKLTVTTTDTTIFQNGAPDPDYINQQQQLEIQQTPPPSTLPFDYPKIYDNPDLRKFLQRQQSLPEQIEQFNLQEQNLLDQLNQYLNQPPSPLQKMGDFPLDPDVMRDPKLAEPPIEVKPLEPVPLPQTADPWSLEYKGPDPMTQPPYAPFQDPMVIQPPPTFRDPTDPFMNKPTIKPPKYTPISDSGEGGGGPSGFTQGAPIQTVQWNFTIGGDTFNLPPPNFANATVANPANSVLVAQGYITDATFSLFSTSGPADPSLSVIWLNASIPTFNLPAWLTSTVIQGVGVPTQTFVSGVGATSFSATFEVYGQLLNSSLGVGYYSSPGGHIGDPSATHAGGYATSVSQAQDLGITMGVSVGGFSAVYNPGTGNPLYPANWRVYQIHIALAHALQITVDFSF